MLSACRIARRRPALYERVRGLTLIVLACRPCHTRSKAADRTQWKRWIDAVPLSSDPLVVEIGANDHGADNFDPAIAAVRAGWRALLYEPLPPTYAKLEARYRADARVRTRNELLCGSGLTTPSASCLPAGSHRVFHYIDLTNRSGTHGSATADARCIRGVFGANDPSWVSQLSSLSRAHVLKHANIFSNRSDDCARCATRLGKTDELGPDCMRNVVRRNMLATNVTCACLGAALASEPRVQLLVVDAEGFDEQVLLQYPFATERLRPAAVVYESSHLTKPSIHRTAAWLRAMGYRCVSGGGHGDACGMKTVPQVFWVRDGQAQPGALPGAPQRSRAVPPAQQAPAARVINHATPTMLPAPDQQAADQRAGG